MSPTPATATKHKTIHAIHVTYEPGEDQAAREGVARIIRRRELGVTRVLTTQDSRDGTEQFYFVTDDEAATKGVATEIRGSGYVRSCGWIGDIRPETPGNTLEVVTMVLPGGDALIRRLKDLIPNSFTISRRRLRREP